MPHGQQEPVESYKDYCKALRSIKLEQKESPMSPTAQQACFISLVQLHQLVVSLIASKRIQIAPDEQSIAWYLEQADKALALAQGRA